MRTYAFADTPGPPTITVSESCDTPDCQRRYVLPAGEVGIVNGGLPPMPRIAHMGAYLAQQGWKHDYLMSRWHCPSEGPVYALLADEAAVTEDRESVLATQEWEPVPPADEPVAPAETTVPDAPADTEEGES